MSIKGHNHLNPARRGHLRVVTWRRFFIFQCRKTRREKMVWAEWSGESADTIAAFVVGQACAALGDVQPCDLVLTGCY